MEISIERSPSEESNSELFAHENDAVTARLFLMVVKQSLNVMEKVYMYCSLPNNVYLLKLLNSYKIVKRQSE